jgi:hypothetical protein
MADSTLLALTQGTAPDGSESVYAVQGSADRRLTIDQLNTGGVTVVDRGTISSGTVTFDVSASRLQKYKNGGAHTVAFSNWPASGKYGEISLFIETGSLAAITWPTIQWYNGDGTISTTFSNMGVTLMNTAGKHNRITIWTFDGGTTLYGRAM